MIQKCFNGFAVIGGLIFSTLLTLFVIPAIYSYFSEKKKSVSNITVDNVKEELASGKEFTAALEK